MAQATGCVGVRVGVGSALLIQLGERALCRWRGEDAGAAAMGGRAVGDQAGQAAAVGAGRQAAGGKALDEILDGLHRGLQLKPPHLQKDRRKTSVTHRTRKYSGLVLYPVWIKWGFKDRGHRVQFNECATLQTTKCSFFIHQ